VILIPVPQNVLKVNFIWSCTHSKTKYIENPKLVLTLFFTFLQRVVSSSKMMTSKCNSENSEVQGYMSRRFMGKVILRDLHQLIARKLVSLNQQQHVTTVYYIGKNRIIFTSNSCCLRFSKLLPTWALVLKSFNKDACNSEVKCRPLRCKVCWLWSIGTMWNKAVSSYVKQLNFNSPEKTAENNTIYV
jgi:hypothetical protein